MFELGYQNFLLDCSFHAKTDQRNSGNVEQRKWKYGIVEQRNSGNVEQQNTVVEMWNIGILEMWNSRIVEQWKCRIAKQQNSGNVEQQNIGNVIQQTTGNVEQKKNATILLSKTVKSRKYHSKFVTTLTTSWDVDKSRKKSLQISCYCPYKKRRRMPHLTLCIRYRFGTPRFQFL